MMMRMELLHCLKCMKNFFLKGIWHITLLQTVQSCCTFSSPTVAEMSILSRKYQTEGSWVLSQFTKAESKWSAESSPWFRCVWPMGSKENGYSLVHAIDWCTMDVGVGTAVWRGVRIPAIRRMASLPNMGPRRTGKGKVAQWWLTRFPFALSPRTSHNLWGPDAS